MIYQFLIISSLTFNVICQQYPGTISTTPAPQPPAQVHYVNIGADLAGDYKFGYDTGKGPNGQSFREETRSADGTVRGAYGYTDANGVQRVVKYSAGSLGFKIEDDSPAPSSGSGAAPAPTSAPYRPPPTSAPQVYRPPQTLPQQVYRPPQPSPQQTYRPPQASPPQTSWQPSPQQTYRPPQASPPQTWQPSSAPPSYPSSSNGNYLELNVRPAQSYRAPTPAQTLRSYLPSSYSSPSSSSSLSSYPGLSSPSQSSNSGSSISWPAAQPTLQTYRPQAPASAPALSQPALRSYSGLASTPRPEEESWGPPVINTALLNYNIGSQGSLPVSYLSTSSSSSQPRRTYQSPQVTVTNSETPVNAVNAPVLRSYSGLSSNRAQPEEKWGPPVINTALLSYNIGAGPQN